MSRRVLGISIVWIPLAFFGDGITVLLLPVLLGGDPSTLGLVSFAGLGLAVLAQLAAGLTSDRLRSRLDRRQFLVLAALPAVVGTLLLGVPSLAVVIGAYLLVQMAAGAIQAPQQALVPEAIEPAEQGQAAGYRTAFDIGGAFAAFAVLGWLVSAGHVAVAPAVSAGVLVAAIAVMWLFGPRSGAAASTRPIEEPVRAGVPLPPGFAALVLARFLFLVGTYVVGRYLVLLIADRTGGGLSASAGDAGAMLAGLTLITAAAAIPAGRLADRIGSKAVMTACRRPGGVTRRGARAGGTVSESISF